MRTLRWLVVGATCALVAAPTISSAQQPRRDDSDESGLGLFREIFGPNWNVSAHVGAVQTGRFALLSPDGTGLTQRSLGSNAGFGAGLGVGVDMLTHTGWRLTWTYGSNDLRYRTDNGDGSNLLDVDDVGTLTSNALALEVVRYMFPRGATFTPYGSIGLVGTWWHLDNDHIASIEPLGSSTQWRWGGIASFGLQLRLAEHWKTRLEASTGGTGNPFTGNESFRALGGQVIDEPTHVSRRDYRLMGVYTWGKSPAERAREVVRARRPKRGKDNP